MKMPYFFEPLIPRQAVAGAIRAGCSNVAEIAAWLDISPALVRTALEGWAALPGRDIKDRENLE